MAYIDFTNRIHGETYSTTTHLATEQKNHCHNIMVNDTNVDNTVQQRQMMIKKCFCKTNETPAKRYEISLAQ